MLLEILGGDVLPSCLNSEPDQNAIFFNHFLYLVLASNNHERGHKRDVHVYTFTLVRSRV